MNVKPDEFVKLNQSPLDGYREVKWNVNEKYNHHTLTLKDGYGNSVTLFNDEINKLYEFLGEMSQYKG